MRTLQPRKRFWRFLIALKNRPFSCFSRKRPPFQSIHRLNLSRAAQHHFDGLEAAWDCFSETEAEKKAELVWNVWKAWNSISQETIDKYVASGAKRFAECIALKGGWTGH